METFSTEDYSPIEKLNDSCLVAIFRCLSDVSDKIRAERVCKRWQQILQTGEDWSNFKSFNMLKENIIYYDDNANEKLTKIFELHGKYLTTFSSDVEMFSYVCHLTPNVEKLKLVDPCFIHPSIGWEWTDTKPTTCSLHEREFDSTNINPQCTKVYWPNTYTWLIDYCESITMFDIEVNHSHYNEREFIHLIPKMTKLKSFRLSGCHFFDSFPNLLLTNKLPFNTIEDLSLEARNTFPFRNKVVSAIIRKCPKLRKLTLVGLHWEDLGILSAALSSKTTNLKVLTLQTSVKNLSSCLRLSFYTCVVHLKNLEKLCVDSSSIVNDIFLMIVKKNCKQLKQLSINYCNSVTDSGVSAICELENLTYLQMRGSKKIQAPALQKLSNLVALDCGWTDIEEECLCTFLQKAHRLQALFAVHCDKITQNFLNVAVDVVREQNSDRVLDLNIACGKADLNRIGSNVPSNLNIIMDCSNVSIEKFDIGDIAVRKDTESPQKRKKMFCKDFAFRRYSNLW